jgi:hypothetical protein
MSTIPAWQLILSWLILTGSSIFRLPITSSSEPCIVRRDLSAICKISGL